MQQKCCKYMVILNIIWHKIHTHTLDLQQILDSLGLNQKRAAYDCSKNGFGPPLKGYHISTGIFFFYLLFIVWTN